MTVKKTIKQAISETVDYVRARKEGRIQSLRTGYKKTDKAMIDGIEWQSTVTIGGRPSVGKSAFSDCLVDGCFANNLDSNGVPTFNLLDFNWELSSRVMLLRRLSAKLRKSYKYVISAEDNKISDKELVEIERLLVDHYGHLPILFCEEPETVDDWAHTVEEHLRESDTPTLVRVDHTLLTRESQSDGNQVKMLLNLLARANTLKKKYPVIFMFLTQMNREFETRQEDGSDKSFPVQGDVYGGDAAAMFSETIMLLNKPAKYSIGYYGKRPNGMLIDEHDLFAHVVKNRNASPDLILHYKENFQHMSIVET